MQALPRFRLLTRVARWGKAQTATTSRALCASLENEGAPAAAPQGQPPFHLGLLETLVCPLSKKPLRYEESTNELINEELGIAYPIVDGIPNMIPQAARMIGKDNQEKESEQT